MNCHYCGTETSGREIFCRCCGTRLVPKPEEKPAPAPKTVEEEFPIIEPPVLREEPVALESQEYAWQPYRNAQPPASRPEPAPVRRTAPRIQLPEHRGLCRMIFLGILTAGIYPTVIWSRIVTELNIVASRHDGKRTMPYFAMLLLSPITLMIYTFVWFHGLCNRVGRELRRRRIDYAFGPRHFWLWNILGSLILVGPFIFLHKLMKAMNFLNRDFNRNG